MANVTAEDFGAIAELYQAGQSAILGREGWWVNFTGTDIESLDNNYETLKLELGKEGWNPGTTQKLRDFLTIVQNIPANVSPELNSRILSLHEEKRREVGDTNVVDSVKDAGHWLGDAFGGAWGWVKWIAIGALILTALIGVAKATSWIPERS